MTSSASKSRSVCSSLQVEKLILTDEEVKVPLIDQWRALLSDDTNLYYSTAQHVLNYAQYQNRAGQGTVRSSPRLASPWPEVYGEGVGENESVKVTKKRQKHQEKQKKKVEKICQIFAITTEAN
eukprot:scaffold2830_cov175-Ochromonas_danica.AAC.2